jgi:hypothetical protein
MILGDQALADAIGITRLEVLASKYRKTNRLPLTVHQLGRQTVYDASEVEKLMRGARK